METAEILKHSLTENMDLAKIVTFDHVLQLEDYPARHFLILGGLETTVLSEIGLDGFKALQKILTSSKSILWASCTNPGSATEYDPYWAMTEGLCRTSHMRPQHRGCHSDS
jgi:hypothetical protein